MTTLDATPQVRLATRRYSIEEVLLLAVVGYFLLLRLIQTSIGPPVLDEPYYWMWGQHPALSYYDHPPFQGWVQWFSAQVFGHTTFAMRWTTWAALFAELWVFLRVAQRVAGDEWRVVFLRSTAVFLAMPIYGLFTGFAFHDHLLVAFMMLSGYFFIVFFAEVENGERGRFAPLLAAALFLGLATLTKYNGAFAGVAAAGTILIRPKLRRLLLDWRIYVAAAIAVGMQAPVLIWNWQHDFESFRYQLGSRHGTTGFREFNIVGMKAAIGNALLMASPFVVPIVVRFFWARGGNSIERVGRSFAVLMFWPCALLLLYISNFSWIMVWWTITIYLLFLPFAGRYTRPITLGLHLLYGVIANTFASISYSVVPILLLFGIPPGMDTETVYGWPEIADRAAELRQEYGASFIGMNYAQNASQLAYALNEPRGVTAITPQRNSFDEWFNPEWIGKNAIFIDQDNDNDQEWRDSFTRITEIEPIDAKVWGHTIKTYRIYFAEGLIKMQ